MKPENKQYDIFWRLLKKISKKEYEVAKKDFDKIKNNKYPVVTLFGFDTTGKTSLLKRLCVETSAEIPKSLTVSGRPETFEVKEALINDVIVRDTPGLRGEKIEFAEKVKKSLVNSDAIILSVKPTFLAGDEVIRNEYILPFLQGKIFHSEGWSYKSPVLTALISRIDEIGIDPIDNSEGFEERIKSRLNDLWDYMKQNAIKLSESDLIAVAADPGAMTSSIPDPESYIFKENKSWDRVNEVLDRLEVISNTKEELHKRKCFRFIAFHLNNLENILIKRKKILQVSKNKAREENNKFNCTIEKLTEMKKNICEDVIKIREKVVEQGVKIGVAEINNFDEELEKIIEVKYDEHRKSWEAAFLQALDNLPNQYSESELPEDLLIKLENIQGLTSFESNSETEKKIDRKVRFIDNMGKGVKESIKTFLEIDYGTDYKNLIREIQDINKAGGFKKYSKLIKEKNKNNKKKKNVQMIFSNRKKAKKVGLAIGLIEVSERMGPALEEIIRWGCTKDVQRKRKKKREEYRKKLKKQITEALEEVLQSIEIEWIKTIEKTEECIQMGRNRLMNRENELKGEYILTENNLKEIRQLHNEITTII